MHEQRGIPGQGQFGIGEGGVRSVLGGGGVAEACGLLIERVLVRVLGTVSARRVLSFWSAEAIRWIQAPFSWKQTNNSPVTIFYSSSGYNSG